MHAVAIRGARMSAASSYLHINTSSSLSLLDAVICIARKIPHLAEMQLFANRFRRLLRAFDIVRYHLFRASSSSTTNVYKAAQNMRSLELM